MTPGTYNIKLRRGTKWERTFYRKDGAGVPRSTLGYTAFVHLNGIDDEDPLEVVCDGFGTDGAIHVLVTAAQVDAFTWEDGEWYLNITPPGEDPDRLLEGTARIRD
jgi:hypothetical protein